MKEFVNEDLWIESQPDGRVRLGFRKKFIDERMGECFHVMQADMLAVKKGGPLMVIETNDGLRPIKSPLAGSILYFNAKARNFPDRLTEEDSLVEILPTGVKLAEKVKAKVAEKKPEVVNWGNMQIDALFAEPFQQNVAPPPPPPARPNVAEGLQRALDEQNRQRVNAELQRNAAVRGRRVR